MNSRALPRTGRNTLFGVVAFLILLSQTPSTFGQEKLRLGSWNIKLLGDPMRTPPAMTEDLALLIDFAKVDVLALQEISPTGPAPQGFPASCATSKILDDVFASLNKTQAGAKWRHVLFPAFFQAKDGPQKQWVGVAWKESKLQPVPSKLKSPELVVKLPVSNASFQTGNVKEHLWKRNAHAMMFSAGKDRTDFVVIPVHMKANGKGGDFRPHREAEAKELVKNFDLLNIAYPGEKDIIVLGDTNFLPDDDAVKEQARDVFKMAKFMDLNEANEGTHLPGKKAAFDRFLVPDNQPEFKLSSQETLRSFLKEQKLTQVKYVERFSDHLLIVMEIQIMKDDD